MSKTKTPTDSAMPLDEQISIQAPKQLGLTAKVFLQERARALPQYSQSVESGVYGQSDEGGKIAVDTAGRWLFGVPGYTGHLRVAQDGQNVLVRYPKGSPKSVHDLVSALKETVEAR